MRVVNDQRLSQDKRMAFMDLDRAFAPLHKGQEPSLDIGRFWGGRYSGWLNWEELRRRRRVVLLAEAASGKTEEFRHQCELLQGSSKPAFFLRIEELADRGTEAALDSASAHFLESWIAGSGEGWFFLDSVDEARLNRKNFDTALRRFAKDLGAGLERAHVYVSCRVTDWKGAEDRATYSRYLPAWKRPVGAPVAKPEDYSALLDPIFEKKETGAAKADSAEDILNELLVVQLVPLTTEQYRKLAAGSGVTGVDPFVEAIGRKGLESLTERPGDLLDLADYWNSHGRFGTFAQMLEHGIGRKLAERDPHRPDNEAITLDDAREGAERLAAALTFGKSFTLRAPGHDPDPSLAAGALDPVKALPDWTDARRNALLRRGIFAPATYGRIRFHHRSTQEYLAASWLDRLLQKGCPLAEIFQVLFVERYGVETVVPSLRAEAAWLSLRHPDIRDEMIRREPAVLMTYGDPGSLPIPVRERLLLQFAARQAASEIADDRLDARTLWMFADQQLAPAIRKAWDLNPREDFHYDLMRLIREGAIKGTADLARAVALDKKANEQKRIVAVQALAACDDGSTLTAIAKALVAKPEKASAKLAASYSQVLYPKFISTADLLKIIAKSQKPSRFSVEGFGYQLHEFCDKAPDRAARVALLSGLADLCLAKPFTDEFHRISKASGEIAKHLHNLARSEAILAGAGAPPPHLVRLLMVVERAGREGFSGEDKLQLYEIVRGNDKINRALFWADVAEGRLNTRHGPVSHPFEIYFSGNAALWGLSETDLPWLYADLTSRPALEDKQIALNGILMILHHSGRLAADEATVRAAASRDPVLLAEIQRAVSPPPESPGMIAHRLRNAMHDLKRRKQRASDKESWIKFRHELLKDPLQLCRPASLSSWKGGISKLNSLSRWLQRRTGSDTEQASREWRLLEEGFSREVAEAYRDGMALLWRVVAPARPRRKAGGVITKKYPSILAFAGIGVEAAENADWTLGLTEEEAGIAARHGCLAEEGYPEWLEVLTIAWPNQVLPVLKKQIEREWAAPGQTPNSFLYRYGTSTYAIQRPVQGLLLAALLKTEAKSISALHNALRIVRNLELDEEQRAQLFTTAKTRYAAHAKTKRDDFAISYLALMLMLDPDAAFTDLQTWLKSPPKAIRQARAESTLSVLFDRHDPLIPGALVACSTKTLEALLRLAYSYVRPEQDITHEGTYSPGARDNAQEARNTILSVLLDRPGADAYQAMERLARDPVFALRARRFRELSRGKAERDAEPPAWTAAETLAFERQFAAPVKTGSDLLGVILGVLSDISQSLTKADFTSRALLEKAKDEEEVQQWLAEQMNGRSKGRFHVVREPEVAIGDKPDLIAASTSASCQVAIEVKHGGMGWSARELENALRVQLAEDYLKPENRRHGVLVITHHRDRRWQRIGDNAWISFDVLIEWLSGVASSLTKNTTGQIVAACVGIDAWQTGRQSAQPKSSRQKSRSVSKAKKRGSTSKKRRPTSKARARGGK